MALWVVRAGKHGEHEQKFFGTNSIYLTWSSLTTDLGKAKTQEDVKDIVRAMLPEASPSKVSNTAGQFWAFSQGIQKGDWIALPLKSKPAIAFAEVTGSYEHSPDADEDYRHRRAVKWLNKEVPRSLFDQDLLYSFGSFISICRIERNDAENRVKDIAKAGWTKTSKTSVVRNMVDSEEAVEGVEKADLERLGKDQIAKLLSQKFKGHALAQLVDSILKAQGYTTHLSPPGTDKGIDILAAPGPLGFGRPRICVQVKSQDTPVDRPTLDQLIGAMQNVQADQGLLVSWGGFKGSVDKEIPAQFFRVRLWDQDDLIKELLANYEKLDEDLRAELPLKKIWTVASQEEEG